MSPVADFTDRADSLSAQLRVEAANWKSRAQSERMSHDGDPVIADILALRGASLRAEARRLDRMAAEARWHDAARRSG